MRRIASFAAQNQRIDFESLMYIHTTKTLPDAEHRRDERVPHRVVGGAGLRERRRAGLHLLGVAVVEGDRVHVDERRDREERAPPEPVVGRVRLGRAAAAACAAVGALGDDERWPRRRAAAPARTARGPSRTGGRNPPAGGRRTRFLLVVSVGFIACSSTLSRGRFGQAALPLPGGRRLRPPTAEGGVPWANAAAALGAKASRSSGRWWWLSRTAIACSQISTSRMTR